MRGWKWLLLFVVLAVACFGMCTCAEEYTSAEAEAEEVRLLRELDFSEIEQFLSQRFCEEPIGFQQLLKKLLRGNMTEVIRVGKQLFFSQLFSDVQNNQKALASIFALALVLALLANFSSAFQSRQIADTSFFVLYLLLVTIGLRAFQMLIQTASDQLGNLFVFLKLLSPVYFLLVAISTGSNSAIGFYSLVLFFIYIVEVVMIKFIVPLIQAEVIVKVLNHLSEDAYLTKFAELFELVIGWAMKTLLAGVTGISIVEGLLAPTQDALKRGAIEKSVEALPVVGDALGGTAELFVRTAILIKNGIGITGAIFCVLICLVPIVKMAVTAFLYKLTAAMIQPISDRRIVECISSISDGVEMLLRMFVMSGVLFLLAIAIMTVATMGR